MDWIKDAMIRQRKNLVLEKEMFLGVLTDIYERCKKYESQTGIKIEVELDESDLKLEIGDIQIDINQENNGYVLNLYTLSTKSNTSIRNARIYIRNGMYNVDYEDNKKQKEVKDHKEYICINKETIEKIIDNIYEYNKKIIFTIK